MLNAADNILDDLLGKSHGGHVIAQRTVSTVWVLNPEKKAQSQWEIADVDTDAQLHANTRKAVDSYITGDRRGQAHCRAVPCSLLDAGAQLLYGP
jgi:hypothetical protein